MKTVTLSLEQEVSYEMGMLLAKDFSVTPDEPFHDEFELGSEYILAQIDSEPVGILRLSPWPVSPMTYWLATTKSPNPFILEAGSIEVTGTVVGPEYRQRGLYRLIMLSTLLHCKARGAKVVCLAVEPGFPLMGFLHEIGFVTLGEPLTFGSGTIHRLDAVPLQIDLSTADPELWKRNFAIRCAASQDAGLAVSHQLF
ncbi:MAG: GNAT family N-acetyltransferase [Candidatus Sericytochromatia bacterium]